MQHKEHNLHHKKFWFVLKGGSRNVTLFFMQKIKILRYISMKVLKTTASAQTIKVIPREYITSGTLTVRDDTTNTSTNYNITASTVEDDLTFNVTFSPVLTEGFFYDMTVKNSSAKIIYKDKIFCTDQTVNQANNNYYTVNSGEYTTQNTYDDDYITV